MKSHDLNKKAIGLLFLRVFIGWHFLYEGLTKLTDPNWSSAVFLEASQGPLSGIFNSIAENEALLKAVDAFNYWGLTIIGLLLIIGFYTRISAYLGMSLLLTYYLCAPPLVGLEYAAPAEGNYLLVNKTLIEAAALFVLALFSSENYLALDLLIRKKGTS